MRQYIKDVFQVSVFWFVFAFLLSLVCYKAQAYQIRFGPEVFTKSNSISDVKFLSLAKEWDIRQNIFAKMEIGYWADNRAGAKNAFIFNPGVGLVLNPFEYFDIRVSAGISAQTAVDKYLGSYWNFTEAVFAGFRDGEARVGLEFNHVSCGCSKPNIGRNFLTLVAGWGF